MALIVPYNSQAGIAVANGGRAANPVGASAFVTPGQAAMPEALNRFAHGMDRLGGAVFDAEIRKRREESHLAAMRDVQSAMLREEEWFSQYKDSTTGEAALNAPEDYLAFSEGLSGELLEKYQGNPQVLEYVSSRMGAMALAGVKRMRVYSEEQRDGVFASTALEKKLWLQELGENPDTTPEIYGQAIQDFSTAQSSVYRRKGYSDGVAMAAVQRDLRDLRKDQVQNRLAVLRESDPTAGRAMVEGALKGENTLPPGINLPEDVAGIALAEAKSQGDVRADAGRISDAASLWFSAYHAGHGEDDGSRL